ncbi:MAG: serpin family protein [Planctomycetes bacterium]|nr:serpin family protein [Planctomycetota bacterium]
MRKTLIMAGLLLVLAMCFAITCKKEPAESTTPVTDKSTEPAVKSDVPTTKEPLPTEKSGDISSLVAGNTEFALNLYDYLAGQEKGNIFFSPYSISTALAMTYAGARNKTEEEMQSTLCFPEEWKQEKLHAAFAELLNRTKPGKDSGYQLSVANALWGQKGVLWLKGFLADSRKYYGAGLMEVDYAMDKEKARQEINAWVEKETNDKIKELIKENILTELTRLVLTNAIYFKGTWAEEFDKKLTKEGEFYVSQDEKIMTPMMHKQTEFNYFKNDTFQCLEIPYKGNEIAMVVLLPKKGTELSELESSLDMKSLAEGLKSQGKTKVHVSLPKFKTTCEFELSDPLKEMGMSDAFSMTADFSGLNGKKDLYISNVIHKAFVEVNEEGTEAAAATAVIIETKSMPPPPEFFTVDRPFIFFIRDLRTDSVLFLGRITNPTK